jgi:hypothetical protein
VSRNADPNQNPNKPRHKKTESRTGQEIPDQEDKYTHTGGLSKKQRRR